MWHFFEHKSWWEDDIYWLLKVLVLNFLMMGNTVFFWVKKLMEKIIFTDYWKVLVLSFLMMGNTIFFSAKKLMDRWYLLGLFELSMMFQDLGNTVFHAVYSKYVWIVSLKDRKGITIIKTFQKVLDKA